MNKTCLLALICCLLWTAPLCRASSPDALFPAPQFSLTDQDNKPLTNADLKGEVWIVDFIFTRCGGACPVMTQKMIDLSTKVKSPNVRFVGISVDPAYDTPAVLKQYAQRQGAADSRFIFLTGDPEVIYNLAQKGFHLMAAPARGEKPIVHDERFLLIDPGGDARGVYDSNDPQAMTHLAADATTLSKPPASPWLMRLPSINASLNAASGILLCLAMILIQAGRFRMHAALMIAAVITSTAFLTCYLIFHALKAQAGSATTHFPQSSWRPVYLAILTSHTILAVVIVPLIIITLILAARRRWDTHRRIARPTFWMWLYVSATGVIVYWMLYHLAPTIAAAS